MTPARKKTTAEPPPPGELAEAWRINVDVNRLLLDGVPDEALAARYSKTTRTVASQFAHMHSVRVYHLQKRAADLVGDLKTFGRGAEPDRAALEAAWDGSEQAVAELLDRGEDAGKVKGWPNPPASFLGYLCAHEAHHRGLVLVSLRLSGFKMPKEVTYGLWSTWSKRR